MRFGILDMVGLAITFAFAFPVANYGVLRILDGETLFGVTLVGIAIAMVVIQEYFLDPKRLLRKLLSGLLPSRLRSSDTSSPDK
ncbi:DUF7533 family protein [Haloparvum sp. PAK95]|uniref:DUF7533 family protein n=1 Tax=Haloparvum sp. PAK95 TaxID=3418962 RepID=UPI003D2F0332